VRVEVLFIVFSEIGNHGFFFYTIEKQNFVYSVELSAGRMNTDPQIPILLAIYQPLVVSSHPIQDIFADDCRTKYDVVF
jgi:hypothetical protein